MTHAGVYHALMKQQAIIILCAIALSLLLPPSVPFMSDHGTLASIGVLDVCNSAKPALASQGDMPCMHECACCPLPLAQGALADITNPSFPPSFIASLDERPPQH